MAKRDLCSSTRSDGLNAVGVGIVGSAATLRLVSNSNPDHFAGHTDGSQRAVRGRVDPRVIAAQRLSIVSTTALSFAVGVIVGSSKPTAAPGRVAALCDELERRGEWAPLLSTLDPELATRLMMLYTADRARGWAATGTRDTTPHGSGVVDQRDLGKR